MSEAMRAATHTLRGLEQEYWTRIQALANDDLLSIVDDQFDTYAPAFVRMAIARLMETKAIESEADARAWWFYWESETQTEGRIPKPVGRSRWMPSAFSWGERLVAGLGVFVLWLIATNIIGGLWVDILGGVTFTVVSTSLREFLIGLIRGRRHRQQLTLDEAASRILEKRRSGLPASPYVLYARPFRLTQPAEEVRLRDSSSPPFLNHFSQVAHSFEEILTAGCSGSGYLLAALGEPGEAIGAARIQSNDRDWKRAFLELARHANALVMILAPTSGTMWEAKVVLGRALAERTVFITFPQDSREWHDLRNLLRELQLPEEALGYGGSMFTVRRSGELRERVPLGSASDDALAGGFAGLLQSVALETAAADTHPQLP